MSGPVIEMRDLHVGVDLDGVGYDFVGAAGAWFVKRIGRVVTDHPARRWEFFRAWGLTPVEFNEGIVEAERAGSLWGVRDPMPGYAEMLDALRCRGHQVSIVTARPQSALTATRAWLAAHHLTHDGLVLTSQKAEAGCDIYLDDAPGQLDSLSRAGLEVVAYSQPWNRTWRGPRIRSLGEFPEVVDSVARRRMAVGS